MSTELEDPLVLTRGYSSPNWFSKSTETSKSKAWESVSHLLSSSPRSSPKTVWSPLTLSVKRTSKERAAKRSIPRSPLS